MCVSLVLPFCSLLMAPKLLIRFDLLGVLNTLLADNDVNTRMAACDVLIYLAAVHGNVQAILDAQLAPKLLDLLAKDENTRWKVAKVLKYVTRGTPTQVRYTATALG